MNICPGGNSDKPQNYRNYLHMQVTEVPPIAIEDTHVHFNQNHHSRTDQVKAQTRQPETLSSPS